MSRCRQTDSSRRRRLVFEPLEERALLALAPLGVDLQGLSDSGVYDDDNLTNFSTAIIDIVAAEEGDTIRVYREGVLLGDAEQIVGTLHQYSFAESQLAEGANSITARSFDGVGESEDSPPLVITLDVTSPRVVSLAPAPESTLSSRPAAVVVSFDEPVDPATIYRSTSGLIGSGGDGTFDDGDERVIVASSVAMTGPAEATLDLLGVLVPNDAYQVTLAGDVASVPTDTAAHYSFDDDTNPANDDSGNGHTGTLVNAAWAANGSINAALSLGASDSRMVVDPSIDLGDAWTIAAWYKGLQGADWHTLTRGVGGDHQIIVDAGGYLGTYDSVGGTGFRSTGFNVGTLDNNLWHHLAAVGSGGFTAFYVDGAYAGTSDYRSTSDVYSIGNYQLGGQRFADRIDEVYVFGRALDEDEIRGLCGGHPVMDQAGNILDGEFDGTFPSGNGAEAGDFVATFQVADPDGAVFETESNNTRWEATPLNLLEDPAERGYYAAYGLGQIDPAVAGDTWSDPDYWSFEALAGDIVSVSMDTPSSNVDPYVELRNSADGVLRSDHDSGPNADALISYYTIPTTGTYYLRAGKHYSSATTGSYQVRVDLVRGIQLESDANYANDGVDGANRLLLNAGSPNHLAATVAASVMAAEGSNADEDFFYLGRLNPGVIVDLSASRPISSTLDPRVRVVDATGTELTDADGNAGDGAFLATVAADADYYAVVSANDGAGPSAAYLLDVDLTDAAPPTMVEVVGLPAGGTVSDRVISSFSLTFSEQMDPATVNAPGAFDLREAGPDGQFGTPDDTVITVVMATTFDRFSRSAEFFLQAGPLANGDYRFTATTLLTDRVGNTIDGDANGTGGDPYQQCFTLQLPAEFVLESPDNDSRATATALPLSEDPTGAGYYLGFGIGSIDPTTDEDWWSFEALAGDRVALAVDTPDSGLIPAVYLYGASGGSVVGNAYDGPDHDAYISHYAIPADGTYYVQVDYYSGSLGSYQLRVELARGIDLESDQEYHNDS
ncbi:MAG: Ig-like domain-containing protein, partial [Pirellulales bacterium]|nr:Ig-like domain-containing protein [Pirellulales bacterium]